MKTHIDQVTHTLEILVPPTVKAEPSDGNFVVRIVNPIHLHYHHHHHPINIITTFINTNPFRHHHQPLHLLALVLFILLRPFSSQIGKMKIGLNFSFCALHWKCPNRECGKGGAQNRNWRPLLNINMPPISEENGNRNHFWPLESVFFFSLGSEKKCFFFLKKLP